MPRPNTRSFTSFALLASLSFPSAYGATSLLVNGGFDTGASPWQIYGQGDFTSSVTPLPNGFSCRAGSAGCLGITNDDSLGDQNDPSRFMSAIWYQHVAIPAATEPTDFSLTWFVKSSIPWDNNGSDNQYVVFNALIYAGDYSTDSGATFCENIPASRINSNGGWTKCTATWTDAPPQAFHDIYLNIEMRTNRGNPAVFFAIDDIAYVVVPTVKTVTNTVTHFETKTVPPTSTVTIPATETQTLDPVVEDFVTRSGTLTIDDPQTATRDPTTATETFVPPVFTSTITQTSTSTPPGPTVTATTTRTTVQTNCIQIQAVFPAACCPTNLRSFRRITKRSPRAFGDKYGSLHRRARVTSSVDVTNTATVTEVDPTTTQTEIVNETPTITNTIIEGPETTTATPTTVATVDGPHFVTTETAATPTEYTTVVTTLTLAPSPVTVTTTAQAQATSCAVTTKYTQPTCPKTVVGGLIGSTAGATLALLNSLRIGQTQPLLVKCGNDVFVMN